MKIITCLAILSISCASSSESSHSVEVTAATVQIEPVVIVAQTPVVTPPAPLSPKFEHLRDYTLDVMKSWPKGSKELPTADLVDVASDIAASVQRKIIRPFRCSSR